MRRAFVNKPSTNWNAKPDPATSTERLAAMTSSAKVFHCAEVSLPSLAFLAGLSSSTTDTDAITLETCNRVILNLTRCES